MVYRQWTNDSVSEIVNYCNSFLFLIILSVLGTIYHLYQLLCEHGTVVSLAVLLRTFLMVNKSINWHALLLNWNPIGGNSLIMPPVLANKMMLTVDHGLT